MDAQIFVPDLEICWGSLPVRRPNNEHRYGQCQCPSRRERFLDQDRLETATTEERDTVLEMICRHFNAHPLIPDRNGTFKTSEAIHRDSIAEMYGWCKARNYFRMWAYLFVNWYKPEQWQLWARSSNAHEIPVLKTTMIVEGHWRKLKHDFLHRFNRPRIDLVVYIITSRVIPDVIDRMKAIQNGVFRKHKAGWRIAFKKEWKEMEGRVISNDALTKYHTDPYKWVCGCPAFLQSRFLTCKHIVRCYEPIADTLSFFETVRRQRTSPFWVDQQLVLRPEYLQQEI